MSPIRQIPAAVEPFPSLLTQDTRALDPPRGDGMGTLNPA